MSYLHMGTGMAQHMPAHWQHRQLEFLLGMRHCMDRSHRPEKKRKPCEKYNFEGFEGLVIWLSG